MEKHELILNGQKIIIMEQPAQFILDLERKYSDRDLLGYAREILKYPAGENLSIEEIVNVPSEIKYKDLSLNMLKADGKKDLEIAQELFLAFKENKINPAYVAELYLQKLNKSVNDYKYRELLDMGREIFKQVGEVAKLVAIIETFRNC